MTDPHNYVDPRDTPDFIARHDADWSEDEILEQFGFLRTLIKGPLTTIAERPQNLRALSRSALEMSAFTHLHAPGSPDLWSTLRLAARAIAADAARQSPGAGPVTVDLGLGPVELPRCDPYPSEGAEIGDVVTAYHAAFASRDRAALALLAQCDMNRLMRTPAQLAQHLIGYPYALGLQTMLRGGPRDGDAGTQLLIDAMSGCNDPGLDPRIIDFAVFTQSPAIELALRHTHTDEFSASRGWAPVNDILRQALTYHRHYWRDIQPGGEPQNRKTESFIALGPLAYAALRHDADLPVSIRSDYLPDNIVRGQMPQEVAAGGLSLSQLG